MPRTIKITNPQDFREHLKKMRTEWGSTVVARTATPKFTGQAMSAGFVANQDSLGKGPKGRFRIGKQTVYPIDNYIDWLIERSTDKKASPVEKK